MSSSTATFTALNLSKLTAKGIDMVSAVILVNTDIAGKENVLQRIKQVSGVEEAHALYGVYDFLIKVNANSIDSLREIIKYNLTQLVGIVKILTLMIVEH